MTFLAFINLGTAVMFLLALTLIKEKTREDYNALTAVFLVNIFAGAVLSGMHILGA